MRKRGICENRSRFPPKMLSARIIFVRYVVFAILSGLSNLTFQELVACALPLAPIVFSILIGTGIGFLVKYVLDKRCIFLDEWDGRAAEARKIATYGMSGIATTLLFWAVELGCWHLWRTIEAKYVGAGIGLSLGHLLKYLLDKRFVFAKIAP